MAAREELGIGYVAFSPLGNGFLSAACTKDSVFEKGVDYRSFIEAYGPEEMDRSLPLTQLVRAVADAHRATLAQVALAWTMLKPYVVPIPGTRKATRLSENIAAAELELTAEEVAALNDCLDQFGY